MNTLLHRFGLVTLLAFLLGACASTPSATTDHDPGFDFGAVQSIAILPVNRQVTAVTAISDMQASRIAASLREELQRRGYRVTDDFQSADLLMTWHLVTEERTDIRTYNTMSARYTRCWHCAPSAGTTNVRVQQFTQGTMIVDLIDPERQISVWRSIIEQRLRERSDEQAAENRAALSEALFADFPPA